MICSLSRPSPLWKRCLGARPSREGLPVIRFDGVSKRYGGQDALARVDLEVAQGEMVFLTGHSGAGNSTLMKLIMLMERPSQGQVFVDGRNLNRLSRSQIPYYRRQVGVRSEERRVGKVCG